MARLYCQVTGIVLLLVGVLGVLQFGIPGFPSINEPAEIVVHFVTGALAIYAGFSGSYGFSPGNATTTTPLRRR